MNTCGIILSGGKSSRMGTDKSLLPLGGKPVIQHIATQMKSFSLHQAIITNFPEKYDFLDIEKHADRYPGRGPLAGLESALYHIDTSIFICAACDMPYISAEVYNKLLCELESYDAVVPVFNDRIHPLSGIYTKRILPFIQQQLEQNQLKVRDVFRFINVNYADNFEGIPENTLKKHFFNMNNPEQYEEAKHF
ncbi:molybdenum cofactor guanylyltransferase [Virgibacillus ihumii]|uniref:molybdenum cofactor guanylyltransferase n=1 Tax=Virgibacillus ihumii TaxID=2686091 RepID=UPI00157D4BF1|nr:molybdenum cofactor guanylyltransferase [Virgibacillus ihumii]